jgi:hypothetical protein
MQSIAHATTAFVQPALGVSPDASIPLAQKESPSRVRKCPPFPQTEETLWDIPPFQMGASLSSSSGTSASMGPERERGFSCVSIESMDNLRSTQDTDLLKIWPRIRRALCQENTGYRAAPLLGQAATVEEIRSWMQSHRGSSLFGRVQTLDLSDLQLQVVPPEVLVLNELRDLNLSNNWLQEIPSFSQFTRLKSLNLSCNNIKDVSFLQGLTTLQFIQMAHNAIQDISPLTALNGLGLLYLAHNDICSVEGFQNLRCLRVLDLSFNRVQDVTCLGEVPLLYALNLSHNQVGSVDPLKQLAFLRSLDLSFNEQLTEDPHAPYNLGSLSRLHLCGTGIGDLENPSRFAGVEELTF